MLKFFSLNVVFSVISDPIFFFYKRPTGNQIFDSQPLSGKTNFAWQRHSHYPNFYLTIAEQFKVFSYGAVLGQDKTPLPTRKMRG